MVSFNGTVRFSSFTAKQWSMLEDKERNQPARSGISYKGQLIDEDAKIQPSLKIDEDLFKALNLGDEEQAKKYLKKDLNVSLVFSVSQGDRGEVATLLVTDMKLVKTA